MSKKSKKNTCLVCGKTSSIISGTLGICPDCIRNRFSDCKSLIKALRENIRPRFGLPPEPPRSEGGIVCPICVNECSMAEGESGFCGVRANIGGKLVGVSAGKGKVSFYHDSLPTNCVGDWVCPGGSGCGYPDYSYKKGPETGYKNLAVFYHACSMDCLFCQNWHFRELTRGKKHLSAADLAKAVDNRTSCICYFGGDPTPQLPHSLRTSRIAREQNKGRILRICWETNGTMNPLLLDAMLKIAFDSGGLIKFDLKSSSENMALALTGVSNRRTWENFEEAAKWNRNRPGVPVVIASTLLIPGYIDPGEIYEIAGRIAKIDPDIPYSLLGFYPQFLMDDLPTTSGSHAEKAYSEAIRAGLNNVRIGNIHLLGDDY
ncbi:MAG: radical SAM protein [Candidatus Eremiobacteraeota bacterium]|nr:radical SAM protein [Candidatus Eremiobacteraeota bacterium]